MNPETGHDPVRVRAARIGARARWGEPRFARLHRLTPQQRRLVLDLVAQLDEGNPTTIEPVKLAR